MRFSGRTFGKHPWLDDKPVQMVSLEKNHKALNVYQEPKFTPQTLLGSPNDAPLAGTAATMNDIK